MVVDSDSRLNFKQRMNAPFILRENGIIISVLFHIDIGDIFSAGIKMCVISPSPESGLELMLLLSHIFDIALECPVHESVVIIIDSDIFISDGEIGMIAAPSGDQRNEQVAAHGMAQAGINRAIAPLQSERISVVSIPHLHVHDIIPPVRSDSESGAVGQIEIDLAVDIVEIIIRQFHIHSIAHNF